MWKNAIVCTVTLLFGMVLGLFGALDLLAPYKSVLLHRYGWPIGIYAGLLAVNLYAAFFLLTRKLFLKDTGTKLVHLENSFGTAPFPTNWLSN